MQYVTLFFFFSSRRRHTRYWRDWSSDVCSSDLVLAAGPATRSAPCWAPPRARPSATGCPCSTRCAPNANKIGRGSCRGRGEILGVAGSLKKNKKKESDERITRE